jgi:hypothetical protein
MLTLDELKLSLPSHLKTVASQDLVDKINTAAADPDMAQNIRENFLSYTNVLKDGRFRTEDYLNAVTYVSYKLMGFTNLDSYKLTFPIRYRDLVARGASEKDISSFVASYNKNKLVNLVLEQTMIPIHILNQDAVQKAINVQVQLMMTANSEKVRSDAANSILTHLKTPETKKIELDLGIKETSGMNELKGMLSALAERSLDLIAQGVTTREIAHQDLVPMKDVTPEKS